MNEEQRKQEVLKDFIDQRHTAYDGVNQDVFEAQLNLALKTPSELMYYAMTTEPTFIKFHGCNISHLSGDLHTCDDQGFEGQIMQRKDGSKWYCRWYEQDINYVLMIIAYFGIMEEMRT